ncbi:MAG: asparagine synthase (glutamine-hydrolyzing) [Synechococcales bacterium]|nr:asparagine synthase (glutamine-hydrolyzing) [Synechococcales bacterium]
MCGIVGFWNLNADGSAETLEAIVRQMSDTLHLRGPDSSGDWADPAHGIALGHRRLAIVDLSPSGHQPMISADGRYVIVFNGEIYNFPELRQQLQAYGHHFRGHSDTEIMLASFSQWGISAALQKFNGMFAFALWDRQIGQLTLARDRLGEKPLYYGWVGNTFLFGSELKALKAHPQFTLEIDRQALALFLRHNYIPAPHSIYQGIYKLPAAHQLTITGREMQQPIPYWSLQTAATAGIAQPFTGSAEDAIAVLDDLLREAVAMRMVADVPLGAFLSGGVDSSTIVALMQAQSARPVKTFTIGFHEGDYNEALYAKAVAQHLGTDHTELYVTPEETLAVIPKLPQLYDEPFSDPSQVPTYLISQLARQNVTVALSGDGGDELFSGYRRYAWGNQIWNRISWLPRSLRNTAARSLVSVSSNRWNQSLNPISAVLPSALQTKNPGDRLHKLADVLAIPNAQAMYLRLTSHWNAAEDVVQSDATIAQSHTYPWLNLPNLTQEMMYYDMMTYLPDDVLVKVDRASMGVSLESRVPLLDHRLVEFAWKLPLELKVRQQQRKWILRQVLYRYVPKALIERPKQGFSVPIETWLRHELRDWAADLLNPDRLKQEGFFNADHVQQKWQEHQSGERNWQSYLWDILMFQAWLDNL